MFIQIPQFLNDKIWKLSIEIQSLNYILEKILNNEIKLSDKRLYWYQKQFNKKQYQYQKLISRLLKYYITPKVKNKEYQWTLNYNTRLVEIKYV